jgi:hypothetical protein
VVVPIVCSVLAIVFAIQARAEIEESGGRLSGASNAQVGLILGWVGLAISAAGLLAVVLIVAGTSSGGGFS